MSRSRTKTAPSPWRDLARDWKRWSRWERRCAAAFGFGLMVVIPAVMRWSYHAAQLL